LPRRLSQPRQDLRQAQNCVLGLSRRPTGRPRRDSHSVPAGNHPCQSPTALIATGFAPLTPKSKKPDRYWFPPRSAKRPLIPIAEIGYVRRSEVSPYEQPSSRSTFQPLAPYLHDLVAIFL